MRQRRGDGPGGEIALDLLMQLFQLRTAAVHVADRVNSPAARQPARRANEIHASAAAPRRVGPLNVGIAAASSAARTPRRTGRLMRARAARTVAGLDHRALQGRLASAFTMGFKGLPCASEAEPLVGFRAEPGCCASHRDRRKPLAKITFPVEASHIMMFARAIGDTNPVYHDAEAAKQSETDGIIPPPTFVQAVAQFDPDYFLRPKPGEKWFGSAKGPTGVDEKPKSTGGLHAEQHYEYHLPISPRRRADRRNKSPAKPGNARANAPAN